MSDASSSKRRVISGWGQVMKAHVDLHDVAHVSDIVSVLSQRPQRGVIARGLGRSYGDPAQNSGGDVMVIPQTISKKRDSASSDFVRIDIDAETGKARVGSGVSIEQLLRVSIPLGWFVPVTPGTRFVSIGGAIAADIHGKNHHVDGSFGSHVIEMSVLLSSGEVVDLSPTLRPEWFWATVGGMGLTGLVLDAVIQLIPITANTMEVATERASCLDDVLAEMSSDTDDNFRYSVAWIDLSATGKSLGRSVITRANHSVGQSDQDILTYDPKSRLSIPRTVPNGLLNSVTVRAFNELWYRKTPRKNNSQQSITKFFHPLDGIANWNRLYGSHGFMQYQCIIPFGKEDVLQSMIQSISRASLPSFLAVLKRMGSSNQGFLSFPMRGWTLALDFPTHARALKNVLPQLDAAVLEAGGRHYLAKDAHMTSDMVAKEYPDLGKWRSACEEMDPLGMWQSDLSRRLLLRKGY